MSGVFGVKLHSGLMEEEDGEDIGDGGGRGGVPALGDSDCPTGIDPQLVSNIFPEGVIHFLLDLLASPRDSLGWPAALLTLHKI